MTLSDQMKMEAIHHGLCDKWTGEWADDSSKDELIDKFVKGIDFCIKNDWPSVYQINELFGDRINEHGVYCDQNGILYNPKFVILNGDCDFVVSADGCVTEIWVRHNSKLRIEAKNGATVYIKMLDNAEVSVDCRVFSKAFTYKYSDTVKLTTRGPVKCRERIGFFDKK